jgi:hypothetical protein
MDAKFERMQQWKAGFLALILLISMCLVMPAAGGWADWYNEMNSDHTTATTIFEALDTHDSTNGFDADGTTALRFASADVAAPKSYFYYYNGSTTVDPLNKCNVTALTGGVPTVTATSTAGNLMTGNDTGNLTNGFPYWVLVFDYRAYDAYYNNVVRIRLNLTGLKTGTGSATTGEWSQGIMLYWGDTGHTIYETSVPQEDDECTVNIDLDVNDLRRAIIEHGQLEGYLTLKITREDSAISLSGTSVYVYSATNLVNRDDALGVGVMAIGVLGFVGALVVQPSISLGTLFGRGKKPGKGRGK